MPSPFPGMDPYLEGYLWPDVHNGLAFVIKELLVPKVIPKYVVHTETYTVKDTHPEEDVGIMYPDVEILKKTKILQEPLPTYSDLPAPTPVTHVLPDVSSLIEVRIPVVEIRDRKNNQLITTIEILSPVNKRKPGLKAYREQRERLHYSGVHLLEIDLLRLGKRAIIHPYLPQSHYLISLVRAASWHTDLWAIDIKDALPTISIPLKTGDDDVLLNLGKALDLLYERSSYQYSIDYAETPPPPTFSAEEQTWMLDLFKNEEL
ncbi:MAG: DUF4058 family protein [Bacteroidota bacterium]